MSRRKVALMGNPNVGKSTVFNEITGKNQHTGNWTGKTVDTAVGEYYYKFNDYDLVDLPGTYSLLSSSEEERVARDYICFEKCDCVVIVADATNLFRNLNLVLQTLEVTSKAVLLLNLNDEAIKRNISVDEKKLSELLGIPVVKATARSGKGINELLEEVHKIVTCEAKYNPVLPTYISPIEQAVRKCEIGIKKMISTDISTRFLALRLLEDDDNFNHSLYCNLGADFSDDFSIGKGREILSRFNLDGDNYTESITASIFSRSRFIISQCQKTLPSKKERRDGILDKILMGKYTSYPVMFIILAVILWLTIKGSNYPSEILQNLFGSFQQWFGDVLLSVGVPYVAVSLVVYGILRVLLWVVAVMLPPMTIFFPLFALMEDYGILPRIAFNLDYGFEKCSACGKQALTTCMGYGCNAVGVIGARIIDSPRERLIAIITNSLTPCNGRFPFLIVVISMFFCKNSAVASLILLSFIAFSMAVTMISSKLLSQTVLKGERSSFILELSPYRKPQFLKVIWKTVKEKILFVLLRAVVVAAPAGLIIWLLANIKTGDTTVLSATASALDPIGNFLGFDGVMLLAFILGFPANEIVIPIALMAYLATGEMGDYSSVDALKNILVDNGWTATTALCTCVFSMFHFPCSTTLISIYKETKSFIWTLVSVVTPLFFGTVICALLNLAFS